MKKYRPKPVNPLAFLVAMNGAKKLTMAEQLDRAAKVRASVELLIQSQGDLENWRDVFDVVNMIEALSKESVIKDCREFIDEMQKTIVCAMDRMKQTGSNVLRPIEVNSLRDLSATWAEVLSVVTCREYFAAEERVIRKVNQALRKGSHGSVKVLSI